MVNRSFEVVARFRSRTWYVIPVPELVLILFGYTLGSFRC